MARSAWTIVTIVTASALLIGVSACTSRAPDFAIDFQSSSDGAEASAETFRSGTGASIYVGFASTPPPGAYLSFDELVYTIGLLGVEGTREAFRGRRLVAVDEWELDGTAHPGTPRWREVGDPRKGLAGGRCGAKGVDGHA